MKRIIIISAFLVALTACTSEPISDKNGTIITINATIAENDNIKSIIQGSTGVYWERGDEVKLFFDGVGSRLSSTISEPSAISSFSGTFNGVISFNEGFADDTPLWGLYPYRADATADNSSVTTTLPSDQTGRADSFAKGSFITLAKSHNLQMGFYNVCGGVRFSLMNDNISEVVFEGKNDETLAGKVKLTFDGSYPIVSKVESGEKFITLSAPDGSCFEKGKWYYIVALPGTLSKGFDMTFKTADGYALRSSSNSVTIKRGVFGSLENVDQGLTFIQKGSDTVGNNIVFKDPAAKFACIAKYDTNGDGEVSYDEAEVATSFIDLFTNWKGVVSFDEIKYFKNVHSISGLFNGCDKLISVIIPENITDLGTYAFSGCASLTSVKLPSGIKKIGSYSFQNCSKLSSISIPSNVVSIEQNAFQWCSSLMYIELPLEMTFIGQNAFDGCSNLISLDLPSGITYLSDNVFRSCRSLNSIGLPSNLSTIGSYAFYDCSSLETINMPAKVVTIHQNAFEGCSSLIYIVIPEGVSLIPKDCFKRCESLKSIDIPSSVTSVGDNAFYGVKTWCLKFPSGTTSLGENCFGDGIPCVILPSTSPVSIQSTTFNGTKRIFVPSNLIKMYTAMTTWSDCSSRLRSLSAFVEQNEIIATDGAVDMGLSVKWAACNLGAESPEDYGGYYQWAGTNNVSWVSVSNCPYYTGSGYTKYVPSDKPSFWSGEGYPDNKTVLDPEDDAAYVNLGGKWRMPTEEEFVELEEYCAWEWTSYKGIPGYMACSLETGNQIFFPAAGYIHDRGVSNEGAYGIYYTSTLDAGSPSNAKSFEFYSYSSHWRYIGRCIGQSVRPVLE